MCRFLSILASLKKQHQKKWLSSQQPYLRWKIAKNLGSNTNVASIALEGFLLQEAMTNLLQQASFIEKHA